MTIKANFNLTINYSQHGSRLSKLSSRSIMRASHINCDYLTNIYYYFCLDERGDGAVATLKKSRTIGFTN